MLFDDIAVLVDQGFAHSFCVIDINAEDNCLRVPVRLFEELSYLLCHDLRSFLDDELPIEILFLVYAVINWLAVVINGASLWTPTVNVNVWLYANDLVRGEKAVLDALF